MIFVVDGFVVFGKGIIVCVLVDCFVLFYFDIGLFYCVVGLFVLCYGGDLVYEIDVLCVCGFSDVMFCDLDI